MAGKYRETTEKEAEDVSAIEKAVITTLVMNCQVRGHDLAFGLGVIESVVGTLIANIYSGEDAHRREEAIEVAVKNIRDSLAITNKAMLEKMT